MMQFFFICMSHDKGLMKRFLSDTPEEAYEEAQDMGFDDVHAHRKNGETMFMPGASHEALENKVGDKGTRDDVEMAGDGSLGLGSVEDMELDSVEGNTDGRLL